MSYPFFSRIFLYCHIPCFTRLSISSEFGFRTLNSSVVCGYAFDGSPVKPFITPKTDDSANTKKTSRKNLFQKRDFSSYTDTNSKKRKNDDALPVWIYIATFAVFVGCPPRSTSRLIAAATLSSL